MNYEDEQKNEIEALEAIYPNELKVITTTSPAQFTITIKTEQQPEEDDKVEIDNYEVILKFTFAPSYPDEVPVIELEESVNMEEQEEGELLDMLKENASQSLGMVMVFTLVTTATEWLNQLCERRTVEKKEYEERKKKEEEEIEMKKFEGTKVTVESFLVWKKRFETEMTAHLKKPTAKSDSSKKLTGRELFERDKSLVDSDLQFLLQEDADLELKELDVQVDESLFEELDGLDLEDE